jgi:hypothetical protein
MLWTCIVHRILSRKSGGVDYEVTNAIASYIVPLSRSIHYIQHGIPLWKERLLNLALTMLALWATGNQNRYVYSKFDSSSTNTMINNLILIHHQQWMFMEHNQTKHSTKFIPNNKSKNVPSSHPDFPTTHTDSTSNY